ncbi:hypothetical protein [Pygmaiobacter massiliensis]|uniref:hypothetical protein n=1 Tax=Pygmaiobacter massiliensis TaxID=1917873 RepID=UPI002A83A222|nr:hypothetical protein [Pygmaiobacter massiliensis]MDY4784042.1 hypothetical protein [Pygmaiobacter massiliensis]
MKSSSNRSTFSSPPRRLLLYLFAAAGICALPCGTLLLAAQYPFGSLLAGKLPNGTVAGMADGPTSVFSAIPGTNFAQMALYISLALLLVIGILLLMRRRKP